MNKNILKIILSVVVLYLLLSFFLPIFPHYTKNTYTGGGVAGGVFTNVWYTFSWNTLMVPIITTPSLTATSTPKIVENTNKNSDTIPVNQKTGCSLLPYKGTIPLSQTPYYSSPNDQDLRGGMVCNFIINPTLPVFTFHFVGQEDNSLGNIDITEGNSSEVIQTIVNTTSYDATLTKAEDIIVPIDVNFDGYLDLPILNDCGATGNCSYGFYLYDPTTSQFVKNSFLTNLGGFKPDSVDSAKKQITASWNSSAADWEADIYQYQNNKYILVQKEVSIWNRNNDIVTKEIYELKNGKMELISSTKSTFN